MLLDWFWSHPVCTISLAHTQGRANSCSPCTLIRDISLHKRGESSLTELWAYSCLKVALIVFLEQDLVREWTLKGSQKLIKRFLKDMRLSTCNMQIPHDTASHSCLTALVWSVFLCLLSSFFVSISLPWPVIMRRCCTGTSTLLFTMYLITVMCTCNGMWCTGYKSSSYLVMHITCYLIQTVTKCLCTTVPVVQCTWT